jgi:hypothetical protein
MRHDVSVYMRYILLDVVVPEEHVWDFMKTYGEEFKTTDSCSGVTSKKAVEGYYENPVSWHIQVKVYEEDEQRLHEFLRKFSLERSLSFREPDTQKQTI